MYCCDDGLLLMLLPILVKKMRLPPNFAGKIASDFDPRLLLIGRRTQSSRAVKRFSCAEQIPNRASRPIHCTFLHFSSTLSKVHHVMHPVTSQMRTDSPLLVSPREADSPARSCDPLCRVRPCPETSTSWRRPWCQCLHHVSGTLSVEPVSNGNGAICRSLGSRHTLSHMACIH